MARRIVIFIFLIALGNIGLLAQSDLESANKLYEIHAFEAAIEEYEKVVAVNPKNTTALANLADCYRRTNQMNDAFKWYGKAVSTGNAQPEIFFQYGLVLKALGRYSEAEQWFKSYASVDAQKGNHFASSCQFAERQKGSTAAYTITKELINTSAADFGATFHKNGVAYASSRADMGDNSTWLGSNISQMLFSSTNWKGAMKKPTVMHQGIKAKKDVGPATYSKDGRTVFYTVNNFEDGTRWLGYNGLVMSIEQATVDVDGSWSQSKALPFNTGGFSVAFPTLSADGQTLYFASDSPDGFGGFDIYMSTKQGESWSSPVNLGESVNTPGDEITPFIDGNTLYFSSNWHIGIGGYDIFKVEKAGNSWRNVTNLGKDINSTRDDICFVYSRTKKYGYMTSNRLGGKGDLDIYRIKKTGEVDNNPPVTNNGNNQTNNGNNGNTTNNNSTFSGREEITLRVINAANLEGVPFALLDFSKCPNGGNPTTNAQGQYVFVATQAYDCQVTITKNDFVTKVINLKTINSPKRTIEIKLEPQVDGFAGFVYDANNQNAVANVLITASDLSSGEQLQVLSNNVGRYILGLKPNRDYSITFSKAGYTNSTVQINTLDGTNMNILGQQVLYRSGTTDPDIVVNNGDKDPPVVDEEKGDDPAWAVQIGVFSNPNINELAKLKVYGNVFREPKGNMMSYKVGTFTTKEEAICIRDCIRKETSLYKDAWVTPINDDEIILRTLIEEDVSESKCCGGSGNTDNPPKDDVPKPSENDDIAPPGVTYKIQLGVYRELKWFPEEKFTDLGQLEIRPKQLASGENANVVLLGNFKSKSQAETMKDKVRARGLPQAFVVAYKNGKPVK